MTFSSRQTELLQSSVPLCRVNKENLPTGSGMGCLADYGGHRLLLTIEHTTGDGGDWGIQVRSEPTKELTKLYRLGSTLNFLAKVDLTTGTQTQIYFAYAALPADLNASRQDISEDGEIVKEWPVTVFPIDFTTKPSTEEQYGFAGLVKGQLELHPMVTFFASELKIYDGLRYLRTEDDMFVFQLPFKHPGHPEFKGCSGAPILSAAGVPVGLVCGGSDSKNEIFAISLARYKTPVDILVGNIK